ncbi:hypothetical protein GmRootV59_38550 [Variovorax sp. V59]|uniref:hypothetical protein n=1 Tax=Variovorax sp. V11 TaxID=3065951 RepID=UPI0034E8CE19
MKLPFDMGTSARVAALRAAGIPVDAEGNARQGFLFVRLVDGPISQTHIFRWFAGDEVGHDPRDAGTAPRRRERKAAPPGPTLDLWLTRFPPDAAHPHGPALQCEPDGA